MKQTMSRRKASTLSFALFLVGIAILFFTKNWWPAIMLVIGIPLALKKYLLRHTVDCIISLIVFIGVFITVQFKIPWDFLLPTLFILGAIFILYRDFFAPIPPSEKEKEENLSKEIEEKKR